MRSLTVTLSLILLIALPLTLFAQEASDVDVPPPPEPKSFTGLSWGMVHTIWNGHWAGEGYPEAGSMGFLVSLRKVSPVGSGVSMVPYLNYYTMSSRVSVLSDATENETVSIRTYFREIDLGVNLQAFPSKQCPSWYIGGGPSVRWGQAGKRVGLEQRPGTTRKAAWFGLTALMGFQQEWGAKRAVFVEPQFTFSPDMADRWQRNYPPETLSLQMGFLW
jgi:hypothetical protein